MILACGLLFSRCQVSWQWNQRIGIEMSHLIRALTGNPDRTDALRDWIAMYVATMLVTALVIVAAR